MGNIDPHCEKRFASLPTFSEFNDVKLGAQVDNLSTMSLQAAGQFERGIIGTLTGTANPQSDSTAVRLATHNNI